MQQFSPTLHQVSWQIRPFFSSKSIWELSCGQMYKRCTCTKTCIYFVQQTEHDVCTVGRKRMRKTECNMQHYSTLFCQSHWVCMHVFFYVYTPSNLNYVSLLCTQLCYYFYICSFWCFPLSLFCVYIISIVSFIVNHLIPLCLSWNHYWLPFQSVMMMIEIQYNCCW